MRLKEGMHSITEVSVTSLATKEMELGPSRGEIATSYTSAWQGNEINEGCLAIQIRRLLGNKAWLREALR